MYNTYQFAGHIIKITSVYDGVHQMCREYQVNGQKAEYCITTTEKDIQFEKEKSEREDLIEKRPVRHFSSDYLETLAVYRKLAEIFLHENILLFHGSAIAVDGTVWKSCSND